MKASPIRPAGHPGSRSETPLRRAVLYPNRYAWFLLFSALDIMPTYRILNDFHVYEGREVNTIADWFIRRFGLWGAILLKFASVTVVIAVCEVVGRRRPRLGDQLITLLVGMAVVPPAWALIQLAWVAMGAIEPVETAAPEHGF